MAKRPTKRMLTLPLWEALSQFTGNPSRGRLFMMKWIERDTLDSSAKENMLYQFVILEIELAGRLSTRELSGIGFREGDLNPSKPSPEWWAGALFDIAKGTASAHGTTLTGVRITGSADAVADSTPASVAPTAKSLQAWFRHRLLAEPRPKREDLLRDCAHSMGCLWREAEAAWNALPSTLRGTRGRPRKASK